MAIEVVLPRLNSYKKTTVKGLSKVYMAHKNNKTMVRKNGVYIIVSNVEGSE